MGGTSPPRFKVLHPTRAACLVLEEYASKITDPKKYKEMQMKDVMKARGQTPHSTLCTQALNAACVTGPQTLGH